ncbi:MAG: hypothetical protein ABIH46_04020, partial [Chloroflexota bacterium]
MGRRDRLRREAISSGLEAPIMVQEQDPSDVKPSWLTTDRIFCARCHREALRVVKDGAMVSVVIGNRTQIRSREGGMSNISFRCPYCKGKVMLFKDARICKHQFGLESDGSPVGECALC